MTTVTGKILEQIQSIYHGILEKLLQTSSGETLVFSHLGDFNQAKVDSTLQLIESALMESKDKRQSVKRFCTVLIEILQNVSLHGSKDSTGHMHAFAIVSRSYDTYQLISGNLIPKFDASHLKQKVDEVNTLGEAELRKLFIETLCNEDLSYKGGAGLGLLTVAKRIDGKIQLEVIEVTDQLSYIYMKVDMKH
ncbi:MAG: SiaB family protein kinase [Flavobacteriales bacterium]|nr:SiaB family protein kinase [Flavobacteriales bacterium]